MFELDFSHRDSAYNLWFSAKFTFFDRNSGLGHKQTTHCADVKLRRRAVGDKCSFYCLREMKWVSGKICFIHECISPNRIAEKVLFFANARRAREKDRRIGMFSCAPEWLVK